jgi:hypothetical protein
MLGTRLPDRRCARLEAQRALREYFVPITAAKEKNQNLRNRSIAGHARTTGSGPGDGRRLGGDAEMGQERHDGFALRTLTDVGDEPPAPTARTREHILQIDAADEGSPVDACVDRQDDAVAEARARARRRVPGRRGRWRRDVVGAGRWRRRARLRLRPTTRAWSRRRSAGPWSAARSSCSSTGSSGSRRPTAAGARAVGSRSGGRLDWPRDRLPLNVILARATPRRSSRAGWWRPGREPTREGARR